MKKAGSIIIALVLAACLFTVCFADDDDGVIKNVVISADGTLTWDKYDTAEEYWLGVDGGFTPFESGENLNTRITEPGVYKLVIEGYTEGGEFFMAEWQCVVEYDGRSFSVYAEQEATKEPAPTDTVDSKTDTRTETEEITTEETEKEPSPETTKIIYDSETALESQASAGDVSETETETEKEAESSGKDNKTKFIIAGICVIIAAAAVIAVVVVRKKSEEK